VKFSPSQSVRGFTLVELLIGATLSAAVMAAVFSSYLYLGRSLARLANQQTLETEARRALGTFAKDVQLATSVDAATTLNAATVRLILPATNGAPDTVTYTFTNDPGGNGTFARSTGGGGAQILLRNILNNGLAIRYYDAAGTEYTTYTDYLAGICQLSVEFSTQTGVAANGTRTLVHRTVSSRVLLRNRAFPP
jgi:type II secretory pathway component PulJ